MFTLASFDAWRVSDLFTSLGRHVYFLSLILVLMKAQEISKPQMGFSNKNWQVKTVIIVYFKYIRVFLVLTENTWVGFHLLKMLSFSRDKYKFYWNWSIVYFGEIIAKRRVNILTFSDHKFTLLVRHLLSHKYQLRTPSLKINGMHYIISHSHNKRCTVLVTIHATALSFCSQLTD